MDASLKSVPSGLKWFPKLGSRFILTRLDRTRPVKGSQASFKEETCREPSPFPIRDHSGRSRFHSVRSLDVRVRGHACGQRHGRGDVRTTSSTTLPSPAADATSPQVVLDVTNGQIVPPTNSSGVTSSPLTILNTSSGLDQSNLVVGLKNVTPTTSGGPTQEFGLSFYQTGLLSAADGGKLDFQLAVNPTLPTPTLTSELPGITVTTLAPTVTTTPVTPAAPSSLPANQTQNQVPEPASLAFWSLAAGLGALCARASRRSR